MEILTDLLRTSVEFIQRFSFLGTDSYVIKSDYLDSQIQPLASQLGMELTIIKYTVAMFLVYPFSWLLRTLPDKNLKHLLSMSGGIILMQWIFGADWIYSFVSSLVTYLICLLAPRKYCHYIVFLWAMSYMTLSHLYRMYVEYMTGVFDFTGTQMVITMKLTSFAYNLYDGTVDRVNVFKTHDNKASAKVYADRKRFAIEKLPNPLEFFGYMYCFTCLLAGPAFEYTDYLHSIDGTAFANKALTESENHSVNKSKPSSLVPALLKFLAGTGYLVGHVIISGLFPITSLYDSVFIATHAFWWRCVNLFLSMVGARCKFYFVWMLAEGSSNLAGFGFQGYDSEGKVIGWEGVKNIDIIGFETSSCLQHLSRAWNKRTQGWLERYTYQRTGRSLMITYFVSALWHGLYPGFFVFFMSMPLLSNVERLFKAKVTPLIAPTYDGFNIKTYPSGIIPTLYWFICFVVFTALMNYMAQVFHFGSLERSIIGLGSFFYLGHILSVIAFIVLTVIPSPHGKSKIVDKDNKNTNNKNKAE